MFQKDEPARMVMIRPPIRATKPDDAWETYDAGKTLYVLIAVATNRQTRASSVKSWRTESDRKVYERHDQDRSPR
jgi:hypothetical protein